MKNQLVLLSLCCCAGLLIGCTPDRPYQPGTDYPEWGFDKPAYYEPTAEPVPFIKGVNGEPDIYYTAQRLVFIKRPDYPDAREAPRPAVFTTKDNGQTWKKEGHFGLGESYFSLLLPAEDGDYGICLIGVHRPDLAPANLQIQQVYVLDSQKPVIEVTVEPKEGPYWTGQNIRLSWKTTDATLGPQPTKLCWRIVDPGRTSFWRDKRDHLESSGQIDVAVDSLPSTAKGVQFRFEVTDQMGNIGAGYTPLLEMTGSYPGGAGGSTREIYIEPVSEPEQSRSRIIQPRVEPVPVITKAAVDDNSSWSRDTRVPVISDAAPMPRAAEAESAIVSTTKVNQTAADSEIDELEQLLGSASNPVYRGRVQKATESEPMARDYTAPVVAATPPAVTQPKVQEPAVRVQQPIVTRIAPVEEAPARSVEIKAIPITIAQAHTPVEPTPEPKAPVVIQEPVVTGEPWIDEPIITVLPPAEPEPTPVVRSEPEPEAPALPPVAPATGPSMIVTAKPPAQPAVEAAPSVAPSQVPSVTSAHGKTRMAKPWERLGNPAAAARDFYSHAPTLSNY